MTPVHIEIPQLHFWLLRIANEGIVQHHFVRNPILFALWYSTSHSCLTWPAEVEAIQKTERARRLSLDKLGAVRSRAEQLLTGFRADTEQLRGIHEGMEVHRWLVSNTEDFARLIGTHAEVATGEGSRIVLAKIVNETAGLVANISALAKALELSEVETEMLQLGAATALSESLQAILSSVDTPGRARPGLFARILGVSEEDLTEALDENSPLQLSGLLRPVGQLNRYPVMSTFWVNLLASAQKPLHQVLTRELRETASAGVPARIDAEDLHLAKTLLQQDKAPGVNLMLYGAAGLDKFDVLSTLVSEAKCTAYELVPQEKAYGEEPSIAYVAQRCLHHNCPDSVLVLDAPNKVLEGVPHSPLAQLFGLEVDSSRVAPFDELMLASNPIPTIWLVSKVRDLGVEAASRFLFHAGLQKALREDRRKQLAKYLKALGLSVKTQEAILALDEVSKLQLDAALRMAKVFKANSAQAFEAALLQTLNRSLRALSRRTKAKAKTCVTTYSLEFLNCAGTVSPADIVEAFKATPQGSLCLYGPSGTGKTQYVEYLAQSLGMPLMAKHASDILSKFVGETEQNIAKMFAEAEAEGAILFLDEADSLLMRRDLARADHEVSRVNEFLQHMERFEGVFIIATNLFENLDPATFRRMNFKLFFDALSAEQRWNMFLNEAELRDSEAGITPAQKVLWQERLYQMKQLCSGDFANVKAQAQRLRRKLTPEQWLSQLEAECRVKVNKPVS